MYSLENGWLSASAIQLFLTYITVVNCTVFISDSALLIRKIHAQTYTLSIAELCFSLHSLELWHCIINNALINGNIKTFFDLCRLRHNLLNSADVRNKKATGLQVVLYLWHNVL